MKWSWNEVIGNAYQFDLGLDAGRGVAVYFDDEVVLTSDSDTWWNNDWTSDAVLSFDTGACSEGEHTVTIYSLEDCCDGNNDVRFRINYGSTYSELTNFPAVWDSSSVSCRTFETKYVTE